MNKQKHEPKLEAELLPQKYRQYADQPIRYIVELLPEPDRHQWNSMLHDLAVTYHSSQEGVTYHHLTHAFDVMTTLESLLTCSNLRQTFEISDRERILYLLAAFGHDSGHEGFTNDYYIKSNHDLAITYLYCSPLENMHASTVLKLLNKHKIDVSLKMKKRIAAMILSTDNAHHSKKIAKMSEIEPAQILVHEQLMLECLLHAADISNPAKDFELFCKWSERIQSEFNRQRSIENNEPFLEPTYQDKIQAQLQFANHFVKPFYIQLQGVLPSLSPYLLKIEANISKLLELQKNSKSCDQKQIAD